MTWVFDGFSHFGFLFFDRLKFTCKLELSGVQLAHLFFLGVNVRVDLCGKVDTWNTILLKNVLDHEEYQLV